MKIEGGEICFDITFDLNNSRKTGKLVGWNLGRGTFYAPKRPDSIPFSHWRTNEREEAVLRWRELRPANGDKPLMRFSGLQIDGVLGNDGYHFMDHVNPHLALFDNRLRVEQSGNANMGSMHYFALMNEVDAESIVTLNFGSGTATEAALYVHHLNGSLENSYCPKIENEKKELNETQQKSVYARIFWGRTEPYKQQRFEIGNEVFGWWNTGFMKDGKFSYANPSALNGGDPRWYNKPCSNPHHFAQRALEYITQVIDIEPLAKFWIPLSQSSMYGWGEEYGLLRGSIEALRPLLTHNAVDAVVIHHYHVEDAVKRFGLADINSPQFIIAGSECYRAEYLKLQQMLHEIKDHHIKVAITEYHVAGAFCRNKFKLGNSPILGLGIADMLILYSQLGIEYACQHTALAFPDSMTNYDHNNNNKQDRLVEPWYNPFRLISSFAKSNNVSTGLIKLMPSYKVTKLIADHLLRWTVWPISTADNVKQDLMCVLDGRSGSSFSYNVVHAVGFVNEDETVATIVFLHRDLEKKRRVRFTISNGERWMVESVLKYAPKYWNEDLSTIEEIENDVMWEQKKNVVILMVPPHSLVCIKLRSLQNNFSKL